MITDNNNGIKIVKMNLKDYDEIYSLWLNCKGVGINGIDDTRNGIEKFLKRNPDTCFTAVAKDKIVGSILVGNDGRRGYIYHTAVADEYRRNGIASMLVDRALSALKDIGISKASLVVFGNNENGNGFWQSIGFNARNDLIYRDKVI